MFATLAAAMARIGQFASPVQRHSSIEQQKKGGSPDPSTSFNKFVLWTTGFLSLSPGPLVIIEASVANETERAVVSKTTAPSGPTDREDPGGGFQHHRPIGGRFGLRLAVPFFMFA